MLWECIVHIVKMKKNNKKIGMIVLVLALIIIPIATAKIFYDEAEAREWKDNYDEYPKIKADAEIIKVWAEIDDPEINFEWVMEIENRKLNISENLTGMFWIPRAEQNNEILIEELLEADASEQFEAFYRSFALEADVWYEDHEMKGKKVKVKKK